MTKLVEETIETLLMADVGRTLAAATYRLSPHVYHLGTLIAESGVLT